MLRAFYCHFFPKIFVFSLRNHDSNLCNYHNKIMNVLPIDIERKSRLLKFCYVPATSIASSKGLFAAATFSTNKTNKAGGTCH